MKQHYFYIRRSVADRMHSFDAIKEQKADPVRTADLPEQKLETEAEDKKEMVSVTEGRVLTAVSRTDVGRVRTSNQDAVIFAPPLYGVADGMGGHRGGEEASASCRDGVTELLKTRTPEKEMLVNAVRIVNRRVNLRSEEDENLSGMGTTLTLLWFGSETAYLAHVGDSRCYLLRDGKLEQVTEDHSMVMEMVKAGIITREQMRTHPMRNVITRAVGTDRIIQVDSDELERREGDVWLICSDGLHGLVDEETIKSVLEDTYLEQAADRLMQLALEGGGGDNISLVLIRDGEAGV